MPDQPARGSMLRNLLHLGLGQVGTTVLAILLSATIARTLGPTDFGLLFLSTTVATFAFVVVDWGHAGIIIRESARHRERAGVLLGSALAVRAIGAVAACGIAVAVMELLGYARATCLLTGAMILGLLPQYLGLSFGWVFRACDRMDRDAALNVALKLMMLVGAAACLALGGRLFGLVLVWAVAGTLTAAIGVAMYRNLRLPPLSAAIPIVLELLSEGAPLLVMALAVAIEPLLNTNILYRMAPSEVVGWFGAASNITGTLIAPATILGSAIYPRLSAVAGDAGEFKRTFESSLRPLLLLSVLGAVGTFLFADVAVDLIYGRRKFAAAADTLRAFAPVGLLMYIDMFLGTAIIAAGRAGKLAGAKVVAVIVTTGLVLLLVPVSQTRHANGGLGVMHAMTIGEVFMLIAEAVLIRGLARFNLIDILRSLFAGAGTFACIRLVPGISPFLSIPLCLAVFAGLSLLVGAMNRADIENLRASFRKKKVVPGAVPGSVSMAPPAPVEAPPERNP